MSEGGKKECGDCMTAAYMYGFERGKSSIRNAPMTSVVTWVRWERGDYDADTLPDSGQFVVVRLVNSDICGLATLEYDGIDKSFYWEFKEKYGDRVATAGDIWAPLPTPPEAMG